jgi:hypothetical protein
MEEVGTGFSIAEIFAMASGIGAILVGAVVALLRIIAPKTKSLGDDKALKVAEDLNKVLGGKGSQ